MPLNPLENLPETLRSQNLAFDKFPVTLNESQVNGHPDFRGSGVYAPSGHLENATSSVNMLANPIKVRIPRNCKHCVLQFKNLLYFLILFNLVVSISQTLTEVS